MSAVGFRDGVDSHGSSPDKPILFYLLVRTKGLGPYLILKYMSTVSLSATQPLIE